MWLSESGTFQTARLKGERAQAVNTPSHAPAPSRLTLSGFISSPSSAKGPTENHVHQPTLSRAQLEFSHCLNNTGTDHPTACLSAQLCFSEIPRCSIVGPLKKSNFLCKYGF